jgi:hypothetical protein
MQQQLSCRTGVLQSSSEASIRPRARLPVLATPLLQSQRRALPLVRQLPLVPRLLLLVL